MSCRQVAEELAAGRSLTEPTIALHLDACPLCRAVADSSAAYATAGDDDFDALFGVIESDIEKEKGLRAWVRSRPTTARRLAVAGALLLVVGLVALMAARVDLAVYPLPRLAVELAALGVVIFVLVGLAVRPTLRSPPSWAVVAAVAASFLIPLGDGLLPAAHEAMPVSCRGGGEGALAMGLPCMAWGLVASLPVIAVLAFIQRLGGRQWRRDVLVAAAAGLAGVMALQLHCPITRPTHLLVGHTPVVAGAIILYLLLRRLL